MPKMPGFGRGGEAAPPSPITKDLYGENIIDATGIPKTLEKPGVLDRLRQLGRKKQVNIEEARRRTPDDPATADRDESAEAGLRAATQGSEGAGSPSEGHPENWGPIGSNVAAESGQMARDEAARRIATGANPDAVRIPGAPAGNNRLVVDEAVAPGVDLDARNEREVQDAIAKLQAGADWEEVTSVLPSNLYGEVFDRIEQGQDERSTGAGHNLKVGPDGLPVMTMRDFIRPNKDFGNLRPENGGVLPKEPVSPTVFAAEPKAPTEQAVGAQDQVVASGTVVAPESGSARPDEAGTEAVPPTIPPAPEEPPARSAPDEPPEGHNPLTQEAIDLLAKFGTGFPSQFSSSFERIARENGVEITGSMTPRDVINALKAKGQPPEEPNEGGNGAAPELPHAAETTLTQVAAEAELPGPDLGRLHGQKSSAEPGVNGDAGGPPTRPSGGEPPDDEWRKEALRTGRLVGAVADKKAAETTEVLERDDGATPRTEGITAEEITLYERLAQKQLSGEELTDDEAIKKSRIESKYLRSQKQADSSTRTGSSSGDQGEQVVQNEEPELTAFRDQYKDSSMELLTSEIEDIDSRAAKISTGIRPEKGVVLDPLFVAEGNRKLSILDKQRGVLAGLRRGKIAEQSTSSTREQEHQARQEARTEYETIKAYSGKSAGELKAEIDSMRTGITGLEERRDSAYARGDYKTAKAMEEELDRASARLRSAESISSTKEAADKEEGKKEAKKTAKSQDRKNEDAMEATRRAAMTPVQLQSEIRLLGKDGDGNIISGSELDALDKKVKGFKERLSKGEKLSKSERKELSRATTDYLKLTNKIGDYDNALKAAKEKAATKSGLKDAESLEDLDDVSKKEYRAMASDKKSDRLTDITRVLPAGEEGAKILHEAFLKMAKGENLNQVELATYTREMGDRWIAGKNRKGLIKELQPAITKYPELKKALLDRIEASKAIDEFKKANPSRWEKMKGVGKGHKGLFMILLILLGGAMTASLGSFDPNKR